MHTRYALRPAAKRPEAQPFSFPPERGEILTGRQPTLPVLCIHSAFTYWSTKYLFFLLEHSVHHYFLFFLPRPPLGCWWSILASTLSPGSPLSLTLFLSLQSTLFIPSRLGIIGYIYITKSGGTIRYTALFLGTSPK